MEVLQRHQEDPACTPAVHLALSCPPGTGLPSWRWFCRRGISHFTDRHNRQPWWPCRVGPWPGQPPATDSLRQQCYTKP